MSLRRAFLVFGSALGLVGFSVGVSLVLLTRTLHHTIDSMEVAAIAMP